eukprot:CAMPEP_0116855596 /NCGR_PEP_ID=MMETSP0418-20121206/19377_1 /TAXON_ID=1158023 /ORGANISM="Astrosyne radiata, Strain 13vi08-1A" /LENGTH=479 /DNA_ID=CAMNT_0004488769 /DNA_START=203 /DNA_END=1642 /DNA_ORIENTATION=+
MAGHSNGCMLAMAMAALQSDIVAAVCCHSGSVLTEPSPDYIATPVWRIHGSIDVTVPYGGRFIDDRNVQVFTGAIEGHRYWAEEANGCQKALETERFVRNFNVGNIRRYTDCTNGADVELVTVTGGGHNPYKKLIDFPLPTTFDTTAWAWDFCSSYSSSEEPILDGVTRTPTAAPVDTISPTAPPDDDESTPILCFSGHNKVQVEDVRGEIWMHELAIGDSVLVGQRFEKVYGFGHYHRTRIADFLQIHTESVEETTVLELSQDHMVFVQNPNGKIHCTPASSLRPGDSLVRVGTEVGENTRLTRTTRVQRIGTAKRSGVYAPFTSSGTIVVNGVLASNYIAFKEQSSLLQFSSYQWVSHAFVAPRRIHCLWTTACKQETYDSVTGVADWVVDGLLLDMVQWYLSLEADVIKGIFSIFLVLVATALHVVEMLIKTTVATATIGWVVFVVFALIVVVENVVGRKWLLQKVAFAVKKIKTT